MDLLLGHFADVHIDGLAGEDLDDLERLLGDSDPDLYNWITGREEPPRDRRCRVLDLLMSMDPPAEAPSSGRHGDPRSRFGASRKS